MLGLLVVLGILVPLGVAARYLMTSTQYAGPNAVSAQTMEIYFRSGAAPQAAAAGTHARAQPTGARAGCSSCPSARSSPATLVCWQASPPRPTLRWRRRSKFAVKESQSLARIDDTLVMAYEFIVMPTPSAQAEGLEELRKTTLRLYPLFRVGPSGQAWPFVRVAGLRFESCAWPVPARELASCARCCCLEGARRRVKLGTLAAATGMGTQVQLRLHESVPKALAATCTARLAGRVCDEWGAAQDKKQAWFKERKASIVKAHMLLLAHLDREPIPASLAGDHKFVVTKCILLLEEMLKLAQIPRVQGVTTGWLAPTLGCLEMMQCITMAVSRDVRRDFGTAGKVRGAVGRVRGYPEACWAGLSAGPWGEHAATPCCAALA